MIQFILFLIYIAPILNVHYVMGKQFRKTSTRNGGGGGWDSIVSIATGYGLDYLEVRVPSPGRVKHLSSPRRPDWLWVHSTSVVTTRCIQRKIYFTIRITGTYI
jgi:hypothetical protein